MTKESEDFIKHFGVKGMRWGVRNPESKRKAAQSEDHKTSRALQKRHNSSLSNNELATIQQRLTLEANVNKLDGSKVKKGSDKAAYILGTLGVGAAAYNMFKSPAGQAAINAGKLVINKYGRKVVKKISNQ